MKKRIKNFFEDNKGVKIKSQDLANNLSIKNSQQYSELKSVLYKLYKEGFLTKVGKRYQLSKNNKKGLIKNIIGKLSIIADQNYGFVTPQNSKMKDVFIAERNLATAFDGDIVEISLFAKRRGKNIEGQIITIIERAHSEITGKLQKSNSFYVVVPDNKKIHRNIYIAHSKLKGAKSGDKVVVSKITWNSHSLNPEGTVIDVLGRAGTYDAEIYSIAREFNLRYKFPQAVLDEADKIEVNVSQEELLNRIDLRKKIIFTIDPKTAKDFDDAISIEILRNGNYQVGIHIADVSHYVQPGTELFNEARKRSTSVYIVGKVIPMLPEKLSNGVCSLVPNEDRLTFSVLVEMTPTAKIINYRIQKSVINSKRRFTYDEVQKIIDEQEGDFSAQVILLNHMAKLLRAKRVKKGSINFITPEVQFELDKNGATKNIKIKEIKESNHLVEEYMLLANQIIAKHVSRTGNKNSLPFVYRVHDLPAKEKIDEFANFVKSLGYSFDPASANKSKALQKLLEQIKGKPEEAVVNEIAIRSMAKAIYSTKNIGHFGLAFKYYTHFTSPIRRFPDLIVHLLIYKYTAKLPGKSFRFKELDNICEHSSEQERSATNAERLSIKLKQMEFLKTKLGEEFPGVISGVTNFGLFIELNDTLAEGLLSIRDLDDDFYIFDEKKYMLKGKRHGKKFRLGDKINVKLVRVDEEKREIDFTLL